MILEDRVSLVTGGSRGIGKAIAFELAKNGSKVIITYNRNQNSANDVCNEINRMGQKCVALPLDIVNEKSILELFKNIKASYKKLDILVNNAGITDDGFLMTMSENKWSSVISTNLTGTFLVCRSSVKFMASNKNGVIVNIASVAGITPKEGQANYAAAKGGVIALSKVLAREASSHGIRVNVVAPGFIDTDMTQKIPKKILESYINQIPLKRMGRPEEVAKLVRFLVSDEAGYITGQTFVIDGGIIC